MQNELSERAKTILLVVLIMGCFLSTLNQTLLNVALSNLMDVFQVDAATIQWLSTGFMLVNGVLVPITAFLMKRFTTRQLFISSMGFLLIGSIICGSAMNFGLLLTGRMIQAVGAGIIVPLMMTVILYLYPAEKRGSVMGKIGFAIIFAPAIAPTLSGFLIEYFSWRWLFIVLIPFVLVVILLANKYLMNVAETSKAKLDMFSILLSTIGVGGILFGFSSAGSKGWDDVTVLTTTIVGIIITALFCIRQIKSKDPLLNLTIFKYKIFTLTSIINVVITVIMYADLILLPIYLQNGRGFTALEAGLLLLPGAVINAFLSPVTGRMFDKYGAKPLFITGLVFIIISIWGVLDLTSSTTFIYLMIRTIILRIGLSFITMPLNTAGLNALPRELGSHGSAVNNTVRQLAGAIGTAVVMTIYSIQTTTHATTLATQQVVHEKIGQLSSILSTNDAYLVMFVFAIVGLVVACFMPRMQKTP
ncbi:DHA2 family efflux MFS transporter permease subunit [Brevibacillus laterosporus]|uniref:MFS transporter n=1 Tax=Brevibacillus laterosporus TaxID=1465 RepID=A0AAP8QH95_BRELA|nr:DHA2 family efflux MFS transporter permease subunit [Brevibacillus laterosporus]MED1666503.1 DHA2 family efflux MFS transporter permease subunit [Brevibacillus laterosporus]MED1669814.1 DHA2 family efflux MFS transporter permease subunit [Brevibacillus laterosporus]MED1720310.1 DHA2 family efflux MFS transporter permease subunit [Brevibacillus laterosporus]PPA89289.1 MFS transporter [Brevibacillus laterosporus]PPB13181.1 MFS transporter [Brevibacillus laterosporus]